VLATLLLSIPLLAAVVGEGSSAQQNADAGPVRNTAVRLLSREVYRVPSPAPFAVIPPAPPTPAPAATLAPTVAPPPVTPFPALQPSPESAWGLCQDFLSINVVDSELLNAVLAGSDLLSEYFGCRKFRIDDMGVPIRFGEITPIFNARVLGYTDGPATGNEIWLNRDCWGIVEGWDSVVAHELGHYLGWQHGDEHPYMWLTPPPGSHIDPGNMAIVC
jgi:hypothetical protein